MSSPLLQAPFALIHGFRLCFGNKELRKLSLRPWLIGLASYLLGVGITFRHHKELTDSIINAVPSLTDRVPYSLMSTILTVGVLLGMAAISFVIVFIFANLFSPAITRLVCAQYGLLPTVSVPGIGEVLKQLVRTLTAVLLQMIWVSPWFILAIIFGFIPPLWPVGFLIMAWIVGYQYLDISLEAMGAPVGKRLRFSLRRGLLITVFGFFVLASWVIPFCGIIIHPLAVAGGAWLLCESGLIRSFLPQNPKH